MKVAAAQGGGGTVFGVACRCLTSSFALAGLGVLLVNDHLLKQAVPGVVTGKLSDFGGLAFFPFLLAPLVGLFIRDTRTAGRISFWTAGGTFALVKAVPAAAVAASEAVSALGVPSVIRSDATDLVALAVLWPGWMLWRHWEEAAPAGGARPAVPAYAVLPVAVMATVATSCGVPEAITSVEVSDNVLTAGSFTSADGGLTWSEADDRAGRNMPPPEVLPYVACHPERHDTCYRVAGEQMVEVSRDGGATWAIAWQIPPDRREFVRREEERGSGCGDGAELGAVDAAWVEVDGRWSFVAALQDEGVVVAGPDGRFQQVAVGASEPERLTGAFSSIGPELAMTALAALAALWLASVLAAARLKEQRGAFAAQGGRPALRMGAVIAAAVGVAFATRLVGFFSESATHDAIVVGVIVAGVGTMWSAQVSRKRTGIGDMAAPRRGLGWAALLWAAGFAPFVAWSVAVLPYRAALVTAVLAMVLLVPLVVRQRLDRGEAPDLGPGADRERSR